MIGLNEKNDLKQAGIKTMCPYFEQVDIFESEIANGTTDSLKEDNPNLKSQIQEKTYLFFWQILF